MVAARRIGLREVILPEANQRDFRELPDHVRKGIKAHFVGHFDEVAAIALPEPTKRRKAVRK